MKNESLKPGWRQVKFGDVVRLSKARSKDPLADGFERYVGLEHLEPSDLRIRSWGNVADGVTFTSVFQPGQVLFGKRRAYQRKVAVADFAGVCSGDIYVLESKDAQTLLPELLPFICQTDAFFDHAVGTSAGSLSPRTNWASLAGFEFALPTMEEQVRLLPLFEAWREASDASIQAITDAHRMRRAAFARFFEHGIRGEERVTTPIGELPKSWMVAPLGERYEVQLGKMMSETARSAPGQTPYLRNANVQWNRLDLDDVAEMAFSPREKEKFGLRYGDILACEGRHVGKSSMWREEIPGACYQKALHRLRRLSDADEPRYLLHCLQYYSWTGRFIAVTGETTIPHLPAERFRAMLFPFPLLDEQVEIAEAIDNIDAAIANLEERQHFASRTLSLALGECNGRRNV
ncbi:restriction endonuclease subunit S [Chromobacterium haemolyticum]|uniref:restriction endonuclease subunit S n=1 Tax=Chromobacterium TaxID=535 RepID=UPI004055BE3A